jgi:hypothetical protein
MGDTKQTIPAAPVMIAQGQEFIIYLAPSNYDLYACGISEVHVVASNANEALVLFNLAYPNTIVNGLRRVTQDTTYFLFQPQP